MFDHSLGYPFFALEPVGCSNSIWVEKKVGVRAVVKSQCCSSKEKGLLVRVAMVCITTGRGIRGAWINESIALTPTFVTD